MFALVFVWYGIRFVRFGWDQTSELADLPMAWIFVAWPLAGFTWLLFIGEIFYANFRVLTGRAPAPTPAHVPDPAEDMLPGRSAE